MIDHSETRRRIIRTKAFNKRLDHAWDKWDGSIEHGNKIINETFSITDKFLAENGMKHLRDFGL